MIDDSPDIQTTQTAAQPSPEPDPGEAGETVQKKRSRGSAKGSSKGGVRGAAKAAELAATAALEARIGHPFADPSLLATAFTHVSALK